MLFSAIFLLVLAPCPAQAKEAPLLLGEGSQTYEWVHGWLKLPDSMNVGNTHGDVVVDSKDRIYFSTDTKNTIYTVAPDGKIIRVWGYPFESGAHGLRLVKDGNQEVMWISHIKKHEVIKASLEGEVLLTLAYPDKPGIYKDAKEFVPTAVDVAPNGDVYVADGYGKGWVHQWTAKGEYVRSWNGEKGKAGRLNEPHGIGIDLRGPEPRVVVADRQNHRLQLFTLDGEYVDVVYEGLRLPSKVATRGDFLVVPDLEGRVTIFDKKYKVAAHLGDNAEPKLRGQFSVAPDKWKDGQFISPHGAAWDSKGNLYVEDWNSFGRVNKLRPVRAVKK